jgi:hypothetical protein
VEVAAESLEVRAEQHGIAAQVLFNQVSIRGNGRQAGRALEVDLLQARHPVVLSSHQSGGGHGTLPLVSFFGNLCLSVDPELNNKEDREATQGRLPSLANAPSAVPAMK